jgi:hypothetical protein
VLACAAQRRRSARIADAIRRAIGAALTREFAGARDEKDQALQVLERLSALDAEAEVVCVYNEWDDTVGALDYRGDAHGAITQLIACPVPRLLSSSWDRRATRVVRILDSIQDVDRQARCRKRRQLGRTPLRIVFSCSRSRLNRFRPVSYSAPPPQHNTSA